ncbi:MAG: glycosyltransferase [Desulfobacterales bacterium]|nr:glycosyltransferase [Desulfobacterales bacterium]
MEKVSIIIPTFNQFSYLPACIDHCLFQTYPCLEIIIVDGGSTDDTKAYLKGLMHEIATRSCEPIQEMDEKGKIVRKSIKVYPTNRTVEILTFENDIGATCTYNEGLKRATGTYCTYIVGDDLPHPHMIEELVTALEANKADFVYSDMNVVDDKGRIIRQMLLPDYNFKSCFAIWYHLGVSHLYKTKWHKSVGLMDEAYQSANDYDHYLRFAMAGAKFYHVPKILYSIRYHGQLRKTGQHTDKRYQNLIEESKKCAMRARAFLANL